MDRYTIRLSKKWFTLIELVFVAMIIALIMPSMFTMYSFITKSNKEISARQDTIQQWYEFFERLNILMQDYTIDYEEYFNRQRVWCMNDGKVWTNFEWNVNQSGHCEKFTSYGNSGRVSSSRWPIYYCSTTIMAGSCRSNWWPKVVNANICWNEWTVQPYGQYSALFTDVGQDADVDGNCLWDGDDENKWKAINNVPSIRDADNIQEMYFISHDGKNRLYFRRKLIDQQDEHLHYKIQMLRLRWFDAWYKHNFAPDNNFWLYDWVIDTWACDYWMWFEWHWQSIGAPYENYKLPADVDDCWVDVTQWSTTVSARNIEISPTVDSELSWAEPYRQVNAYMKILMINWIYAPYYAWWLSQSSIDFKVPIETAINMKDFYRN